MWRAVCLWIGIVVGSDAQAVAGTEGVFAALERARQAAQQLDYRGEFILQRGLEVSHTRIVHVGSGTPEQERLESLDGEPRESLRRGAETLIYLRRQRRLLIERHSSEARFPALPPLSRPEFERQYLTRRFASDPVAGRETLAVALDTRDVFHYSHRFWFDRTTGLLLRAQTVSENGEVIEQVGFRQVLVGSVPRALLKPAAGSTRSWHIDHTEVRPIDLSSWRLGWVPAGFMRVATSSRRLMDANGASRDVGQILYSNGLSSLSVFVEPWSAERSLLPLRLGALNMVGKRHGKFWLTIVGDVPMVAIRQVADAIEIAQTFPR